jgi:dsDNA-specific endonuclease/ATPase MutS2
MWPFKPKPPKPPPEEEAPVSDEEIERELAQELTDELDLHHFKPKECADVVAEYLVAAQAKGFPRVRIIHGKGTGAMRRTVESVLEKHPAVKSFQLAGSTGGWGATAVELHPAPES